MVVALLPACVWAPKALQWVVLMGMLLGGVGSPLHTSTAMWPWDEGAQCVPLGEDCSSDDLVLASCVKPSCAELVSVIYNILVLP